MEAERTASLKPVGIWCLSINPMAGLCWNGSMSCPAVGRVIITIISWYLLWWGLWELCCLWRPSVLHWGQRSRLGQSSRVEFQYSAAYSVPWSPLHSSVNSFTMSFTLLLFTRSLHERGGHETTMKHMTLIMWLIHLLLNLQTENIKPWNYPNVLPGWKCPAGLPEYLLWEVVFLFSCDPCWWEPWWLQRLLQPHSQQRKAVLVQREKHFCKLVHQAPRCPAPDALERVWRKDFTTRP